MTVKPFNIHMLQKLYIIICLGAKPFTEFTVGCQKESVSPLLLALVNMILEGPTITDPYEKVTPVALSIAQLLKVNRIKHRRILERIYH